MTPLIIYHGKCADGYTAAWIALKALRETGVEPELHAGVYGETPPDCIGRDVVIVDFSYPRVAMEHIIDTCKTLTWLDHHATAIADSGDLMPPRTMQRQSDGPTKVRGALRTDRSGAWLTWEWFRGNDVPTMVQLVDDRDRWVFKDPRSKPFSAGLFARGYTEENWDDAFVHVDELIEAGKTIMVKERKDLLEHLDVMTVQVRIDGTWVPGANLTYMSASDAGVELLARYPDAPFAATWFTRKDGMTVYSLRSRIGSDTDVGAIAKSMGGGGHKHASGFAVGQPLDLLPMPA
jgi:oligoribonuclease NrnB/cAMP/cGMP phosphodiesterase (DHH superfamily)